MKGIIRSFEKKEQKIYDSSTIINTDYNYEIRFPLALQNMVRGKKGVDTLERYSIEGAIDPNYQHEVYHK